MRLCHKFLFICIIFLILSFSKGITSEENVLKEYGVSTTQTTATYEGVLRDMHEVSTTDDVLKEPEATTITAREDVLKNTSGTTTPVTENVLKDTSGTTTQITEEILKEPETTPITAEEEVLKEPGTTTPITEEVFREPGVSPTPITAPEEGVLKEQEVSTTPITEDVLKKPEVSTTPILGEIFQGGGLESRREVEVIGKIAKEEAIKKTPEVIEEKIEEKIEKINQIIKDSKEAVETYRQIREKKEAMLLNVSANKKIKVQKEIEEVKVLELEAEEKSKKAEEEKLKLLTKKSENELEEKIKVREELEGKIEFDIAQEAKLELEERIKEVKEEELKIKEKIDETKELLENKKEEIKKLKKETIKQGIRKKVVEQVDEIIAGEIREKVPITKPREEMLTKIKETTPIIIAVSKEKAEDSLNKIYEKIFEKNKVDSAIKKIKPEERKITVEELNEEISKAEKEIEKDIDDTEKEVEVKKKKIEETIKAAEIKKVSNFYEDLDEKTGEIKNNTVVTLTIRPNRVLKNFTVYEDIPKSIAEDVTQLTIYTENYGVIETDPLIMWHFVEVKVPVDISYEVNKKIGLETLKEAVTIPVADKIVEFGEEEVKEISLEERKGASLFNILLPLLIIPVVGVILIYFNRFIGEERVSYPLEEAITSIQNQLYKGFKKEDIKNYLIKKGWPKSIISSAFLILEENEKKKIEYHLGKLVYQIRRLSKRGYQIEEIEEILIYKKRYPPLLVKNAIRKFKELNRKFKI